jgi:imidazolonepropionase-like amidohydrolase
MESGTINKMMMKKLYILCAMALAVVQLSAQQIPAPAAVQSQSILIMNATAHIGNGQVIDNSAISLVNGKIDLVADARVIRLDMTKFDTIIQAAGMHVYPGFIAPNTTLGLQEIEQVRSTRDYQEVGTYKPGMRTSINYNTDSEIIPTVRYNGVLMSQPTPRGGTISGTSCIVQHDAWNWEDALIKADDGVHLNWPQVYHKHYDKGKIAVEKIKSYDQQKREILTFFDESKAYATLKNPAISELRYEAMRGLFDGSKTLFVHADDVKALTEVVAFKKQYHLAHVVIVGGMDAPLVAKDLVAEQIPVMVARVHSLPRFEEDAVDQPYALAKQLFDAGVLFCLENSGDQEHHGVRNLPFYAGTCVAYGLPYEQAVAAISGNTAKILRIDDACGTIESGKDATLFISQGDALDMRTNQLVAAFIQGRQIELTSKQTELYEKFKKKYEGK